MNTTKRFSQKPNVGRDYFLIARLIPIDVGARSLIAASSYSGEFIRIFRQDPKGSEFYRENIISKSNCSPFIHRKNNVEEFNYVASCSEGSHALLFDKSETGRCISRLSERTPYSQLSHRF